MKSTGGKIGLFLMLLVLSAVESFDRYMDFSGSTYWIIAAGLLALTFIGWRMKAEIAFTFFFFALLHLCRPLNVWFTELLGANFNGTYYLIPSVLFIALILIVPGVKRTIGWWQKEQISLSLLGQMTVAILLGSGAMYWYLVENPEYLDRFIQMLPEGSLGYLILMGVAFAGLNAAVEELIFRGMLWNGLEKIQFSMDWIIVIQAVIFGLSHFWGLPGGWTGVLMTFVMALFFGYVRVKTGGILGVILVHFGLNLAQYFMLLSLR